MASLRQDFSAYARQVVLDDDDDDDDDNNDNDGNDADAAAGADSDNDGSGSGSGSDEDAKAAAARRASSLPSSTTHRDATGAAKRSSKVEAEPGMAPKDNAAAVDAEASFAAQHRQRRARMSVARANDAAVAQSLVQRRAMHRKQAAAQARARARARKGLPPIARATRTRDNGE